MSALLEIDSLTKRFAPGDAPAVDEVDLDVREGEIAALLGPSGCGKTTALRLVAGFERPDTGAVAFDGQRLTGPNRHVPPERRGIGLVFQNYALFPHQTVAENVSFGLRGLPAGERKERTRSMLDLVGLRPLADRRPHSLSGGQQQRVALARALAPRPRLLLLDEPFSNLDALLRQQTRRDVRSLLKDWGVTAVLVTHDQQEALSFADRVAVMREGRIEQTGAPEALYNQPATLFVAQFLGRTNLILSEARGEQADTPLGPVALDRSASGDVLVSLRPEHLTLEPAEGDDAGDDSGRVTERAFKGHDVTYRVEQDGSEYLVHTPSRQSFAPGERVRIRILEPAVVLSRDDAPSGGGSY